MIGLEDHVLSIILGNDLIVDRDCRSFLPYSANSLMDPPYMDSLIQEHPFNWLESLDYRDLSKKLKNIST